MQLGISGNKTAPFQGLILSTLVERAEKYIFIAEVPSIKCLLAMVEHFGISTTLFVQDPLLLHFRVDAYEVIREFAGSRGVGKCKRPGHMAVNTVLFLIYRTNLALHDFAARENRFCRG